MRKQKRPGRLGNWSGDVFDYLLRLHPLWRRAANFIETLRNKGDAIQLDRPDPGAVVGAGDFQRHDDVLRERRCVDGIPDNAGLRLHLVLCHHNIPLPALPVLALFGATNDWLQGLPAWIGDRRSGIRIIGIDFLGRHWSRPPD